MALPYLGAKRDAGKAVAKTNPITAFTAKIALSAFLKQKLDKQ